MCWYNSFTDSIFYNIILRRSIIVLWKSLKNFIFFYYLDMEDAQIEAFSNQVGGHTFELQNQGMLHQGTCILKQLQDQGRG